MLSKTGSRQGGNKREKFHKALHILLMKARSVYAISYDHPIAQAFRNDFSHLDRAVQYYHGLCDPERTKLPYPRSEFIEAGPSAAFKYGRIQLGDRPPPPRVHQLEVVFHRG